MKRKQFHIVFKEGWWVIVLNGEDIGKFIKWLPARNAARTAAKENEPSEVLCHRKRDGEIYLRNSYGDDPVRYRG